MNVLVVNAGSSTVKLRLLGSDDEVLAATDLAADAGRPDPDELAAAIAATARSGSLELGAVGHRVVHGGMSFTAPVVIDGEVEAELKALTSLAPLHQPAALAALAAVRAAVPADVPQVACFDTAFHATIPAAAATYAVPAAWRERHGVRRYGFHGLSHAYASRRASELTGGRRVVTCHLGSGASLAAVADGGCVDTTMGFTPLEGLVMATRSGTVDPGLVLWLQTEAGMGATELTEALFHQSGMVALAGTADMRAVVAGAAAGEPAASLAFEVYLHRLRAEIAAMVAALGGLDTLVFTGGVGERSAAVRQHAAAGLEFLGVELDDARNKAHGAADSAARGAALDEVRGGAADTEVGTAGAAVRVLVVEAREDLEMARAVRAQLIGSAAGRHDAAF